MQREIPLLAARNIRQGVRIVTPMQWLADCKLSEMKDIKTDLT